MVESFQPQVAPDVQHEPRHVKSNNITNAGMRRQDLEKVAALFEAICSLNDPNCEEEALDTVAAGRFEAHVDKVMKNLSDELETVSQPSANSGAAPRVRSGLERAACVQNARFQLYDICFEQLAATLQEKNPVAAEVITELRNAHSDVVSLVPELLRAAAEKTGEVSEISREISDATTILPEQSGFSHGDSLQLAPSRLEKQQQQNTSQSHTNATENNCNVTNQSGSFREGKAPKVLTLQRLHDVMEDVYASKCRADNTESGPRETMLEHLHAFLQQKYGLKSMAQDWVQSIFGAIQEFESVDNAVFVFGKILRNEIDEEYRFVQQKLQESVRELLRLQLKDSMNGRQGKKVTSDDLQALVEKRVRGQIHEWEWTDIVRYMYNEEDACQLLSDIEFHNEEVARNAGRRVSQGAPTSMLYCDFIHMVLMFQLRGHEAFIADVRSAFREFDVDADGALTHSEFARLVHKLGKSTRQQAEEISNDLLDAIDPRNWGRVTFSSVVSCLSAENDP